MTHKTPQQIQADKRAARNKLRLYRSPGIHQQIAIMPPVKLGDKMEFDRFDQCKKNSGRK